MPTSIGGSVEWNSTGQTATGVIFLSGATTIGGNFTIASTGTGSIIGGGTTARNLTVGGDMTVSGGTYYAIGGNGSNTGDVTVAVAGNLNVTAGTFRMVQGDTAAGSASGTLTVGGNLTVSSTGTLQLLNGTVATGSSASSMTVNGTTSISGGTLNLTAATAGPAAGVTATLKGDLSISGGTLSRTGTLPATVNFGGTSTQAYSKTGGTISGAVNFAILSGATVQFGASILDGSTGTFNLASGGTIGIGSTGGIATSGATGNIQVTGTRTFSTDGQLHLQRHRRPVHRQRLAGRWRQQPDHQQRRRASP